MKKKKSPVKPYYFFILLLIIIGASAYLYYQYKPIYFVLSKGQNVTTYSGIFINKGGMGLYYPERMNDLNNNTAAQIMSPSNGKSYYMINFTNNYSVVTANASLLAEFVIQQYRHIWMHVYCRDDNSWVDVSGGDIFWVQSGKYVYTYKLDNNCINKDLIQLNITFEGLTAEYILFYEVGINGKAKR